ncbi:MAG: electron transfer flavoprotein-ubiquinone oxidoreductase [Microvirga sp.]|nr:electron transfer flavoprotein-ubiquinone oxidoreductase [Microvirga sp.]
MADLPARESMEFDVVVVGAGPAGLATAIRLKQQAMERGADISVVVVEKGSEVGAHILSGAVIDPIGLDSLLPDWRSDPDRPLKTEVGADEFMYLGPQGGGTRRRDLSRLPGRRSAGRGRQGRRRGHRRYGDQP